MNDIRSCGAVSVSACTNTSCTTASSKVMIGGVIGGGESGVKSTFNVGIPSMSTLPCSRVVKNRTLPDTVSRLLLMEKMPAGPGTCSSNGVDVDELKENWST